MIWGRVWQLSTLSFYSIPFHSEVKDREHPRFISMCRCSICSFHNKASWSGRSHRHITLTLLRIHISSPRPSLPSRLPALPPCIKHTWRHKKTKKKQISAYAQLHNDITERGSYCVESNCLFYSSSLHDCVALSAAENPRSSWKASFWWSIRNNGRRGVNVAFVSRGALAFNRWCGSGPDLREKASVWTFSFAWTWVRGL